MSTVTSSQTTRDLGARHGTDAMATDGHTVYWLAGAGPREDVIMREATSGSKVSVAVRSRSGMAGLAVADGYLYWVEDPSSGLDDAGIDRMRLSDGRIQHIEIKLVNASGLAAYGSYLYVCEGTAISRIARLNVATMSTSGSFIELPQRFSCDGGLTANNHSVFWGDLGGFVGRASVNGTDVQPQWLHIKGGAANVAADNDYIYWEWQFQMPYGWTGGAIGRARVNGSARNDLFVPGYGAIAVTPGSD